MTLGEFKELTKNLPDDTPIVHDSDDYDRRNMVEDLSYINTTRAKKIKKQFEDTYCEITYTHEIYVVDENGTVVIKV